MLSLVDSGGVDIFDAEPDRNNNTETNTVCQLTNGKAITLLTSSEKRKLELKLNIPDNKTR